MFDANECESQGGAIFLTNCQNAVNSISGSSFVRNKSNSATVYLILSQLFADSITMSENESKTQSPGFVGDQSSIFSIKNSRLTNQKGQEGGFVAVQSSTKVTIASTNFTDAEAGIGSAISATQSEVTVDLSRFERLKATSFGAISAVFNSVVSVKNSTFKSCTSSEGVGAIGIDISTLILNHTDFSEISQGAILATQAVNVTIHQSTFTKVSSVSSGGAVACIDCEWFEVSQSNFTETTSKAQGGALSLTGSVITATQPLFQIDSCTFERAIGTEGGAVFLDNVNLKIGGSQFSGCKAAGSNGGAVAVRCTDAKPVCRYSVSRSSFSANTAAGQGGAINWVERKPTITVCSYQNNSATIFPDVGSVPTGLVIQSVEQAATGRQLETVNIVSGQPAQYTLRVAIVNDEGAIFESDNSSLGSLVPVDSVSTTITGATIVTASKGIFEFKDFTVITKPDSDTSITVTTPSINSNKLADAGVDLGSKEFSIGATVRPCIPGESLAGQECVVCQAGFYSLDPSTGKCAECPTGARCYGNTTMAPEPGYSRKNNETDLFLNCPLAASCKGGLVEDGEFSAIGLCETGYEGNLCNSCSDGYTRTGKFECAQCLTDTENWLIFTA